ncbi:flavin reductase family protein [Microbispora amethystogenes]|uniref:Oxidoreductase n=1 Tax=Microbispora amethystogenes TaxID=1427754 RepID=A0ABQ4FLW3_9ACTN|nr:flavin reductase family protein [Microbispora amethystogenes]GIH35819.1 oxidoreductase [Microbispora amethystogenes]
MNRETMPSPRRETTPSPRGADGRGLREALGAFATGVTVVTVGGPHPHGMTANSFTSVSLDPPLVLVCVRRDAVMHERLAGARFFGVSVLAAHQEDLARHFANHWRSLGGAPFDAAECLPGPRTQVPLISGALARFECALWRSYDGGDHTIFLGNVLSLDGTGDRDALLFLGGRFRRLMPEHSEVTA